MFITVSHAEKSSWSSFFIDLVDGLTIANNFTWISSRHLADSRIVVPFWLCPFVCLRVC